MALAYMRSIAKHDWAGACATRVPEERDKLATMAGTCERAFEQILSSQPVAMFSTVSVGGVRKRNGIIAVDLVQPGQTQPVTTVLLRQVAGQWLLVDLPDADAF